MSKKNDAATKSRLERLHNLFCEQLIADLGNEDKRGPGLYAAIIRFLDNNEIRASLELSETGRDRLSQLLEKANKMEGLASCPDSSQVN